MIQWINEKQCPVNQWNDDSASQWLGDAVLHQRTKHKWVSKPMNQWISASIEQWLSEGVREWESEGMSKRASRWINESMKQRINESLNHCFTISEPMNLWINKSSHQRANESLNQWVNEWTNEFMAGWMDEWATFLCWALPWLASGLMHPFSQLLLLWAATYPVLVHWILILISKLLTFLIPDKIRQNFSQEETPSSVR